MAAMTKTNRGGKRPNAGNPPLGGKGSGESRNIVVRLPADMHDMLDAQSEQFTNSKSSVVRTELEHWIDFNAAKNKE